MAKKNHIDKSDISVKRVYPYGKHESHIFYWASEDEALTFTDMTGSQGYWLCDQTERAYRFDEDKRIMVWDNETNCC